MLDIKVGTTETLLIDVTDKLGNLTDLSTTNARYDVYDHNNTQVVNNAVVTVDPLEPLTAQCLINTTGWTPGRFKLYLRFTFNPDVPRLGPFEFKVNP